MEFVELRLPITLVHAVEKKLLGNSGRSVEELVIHVLEELTDDQADLDLAEEKLLAERLRHLGYL